MEENIIFEQEMDTPVDWITNTILTRDGKGNIIEVEVYDDEEV